VTNITPPAQAKTRSNLVIWPSGHLVID